MNRRSFLGRLAGAVAAVGLIPFIKLRPEPTPATSSEIAAELRPMPAESKFAVEHLPIMDKLVPPLPETLPPLLATWWHRPNVVDRGVDDYADWEPIEITEDDIRDAQERHKAAYRPWRYE